MKNILDTISNNCGISEVSGNCIIHPTQENNFLCCYRTTIVSDKVKLSFDGYCDISSIREGATPKNIMDNAQQESFALVKNAWNSLAAHSTEKDSVIDINSTESFGQTSSTDNFDVVPEIYRTKKFNDPMSESQNSVIFAVATINGANPEEFVYQKLGKNISDLTKGEVSYLSDTYGVKRDV